MNDKQFGLFLVCLTWLFGGIGLAWVNYSTYLDSHLAAAWYVAAYCALLALVCATMILFLIGYAILKALKR